MNITVVCRRYSYVAVELGFRNTCTLEGGLGHGRCCALSLLVAATTINNVDGPYVYVPAGVAFQASRVFTCFVDSCLVFLGYKYY